MPKLAALITAVVLFCSVALGRPPAGDGPSGTTVLIIRHAEKPETGNQLTPAGVRRASAYPAYFAGLRLNGHPVHLDHIFAAADSKGSERPRLTVEPLAAALHMPLDLRFKAKAVDALAADLRSHSYGDTVLICWHHGRIPDLLQALGEDPTALLPTGKWPEGTYDWMIEVGFDRDGHPDPARTKLIHEHLMPGDAR